MFTFFSIIDLYELLRINTKKELSRALSPHIFLRFPKWTDKFFKDFVVSEEGFSAVGALLTELRVRFLELHWVKRPATGADPVYSTVPSWLFSHEALRTKILQQARKLRSRDRSVNAKDHTEIRCMLVSTGQAVRAMFVTSTAIEGKRKRSQGREIQENDVESEDSAAGDGDLMNSETEADPLTKFYITKKEDIPSEYLDTDAARLILQQLRDESYQQHTSLPPPRILHPRRRADAVEDAVGPASAILIPASTVSEAPTQNPLQRAEFSEPPQILLPQLFTPVSPAARLFASLNLTPQPQLRIVEDPPRLLSSSTLLIT